MQKFATRLSPSAAQNVRVFELFLPKGVPNVPRSVPAVVDDRYKFYGLGIRPDVYTRTCLDPQRAAVPLISATGTRQLLPVSVLKVSI